MTGRKHDATGRSTGRIASSRVRKLNAPPKDQPWIWLTREMVESPAWRVLTHPALKVVMRVALEHMSHGGVCNGALPITYDDFTAYGVRRSSIRKGIAEAIALGFVDRIREGRKAWGGGRGAPAEYRLAWVPMAAGTADSTTTNDRWRTFKTIAAAQAVADAARQMAEEPAARARKKSPARPPTAPAPKRATARSSLIPVDELFGTKRTNGARHASE